ncbi:MAG: hypothetical protein JKY37_12920 [Nannocystaceae bacterium]|nr:hypothetical protein [Nannocystaceae bacterium]
MAEHDDVPRIFGFGAVVVALTLVSGVARAAPGEAASATRGMSVHLEVRGRATVGLYRKHGAAKIGTTAESKTKVCDAPCDMHVSLTTGDRFVLDGPRMVPSLSFSLAEQPARIDLVVRPGYRALSIGGWVSVALGAAAVVAGAVVLTIADDNRGLRRAGGFTLLSGLPLLIGGGVMASFGRTRFRIRLPTAPLPRAG